MSLMRCEECGKEISDKANVCPHCGFPISSECTIHFMWDNMKGNTFLKTSVYIDEKLIGEMKCGEILDFGVRPRSHRIDLFFRNKCAVSENICIRPNQTDEYFAYRQTLTSLKRVDASSVKWVSEKRNFNVQNVPRCPTCGSTNIKRISMTRKAVSASVFGVASGSILKTFECKDCKYKW